MSRVWTISEMPHLRNVQVDDLPTAVGRLRWDPVPRNKQSTLARAEGSLIVECTVGWYYWLLWHSKGKTPSKWIWAIDKMRGSPRRLALKTARIDNHAQGPHITVINTRERARRRVCRSGQKVTFRWHPTVIWNHRHLWVPIWCDELGDIREACGLRRNRRHHLHLTMGVWADDFPMPRMPLQTF